jgi:hypothetical protein
MAWKIRKTGWISKGREPKCYNARTDPISLCSIAFGDGTRPAGFGWGGASFLPCFGRNNLTDRNYQCHLFSKSTKKSANMSHILARNNIFTKRITMSQRKKENY